jgi:prephenate dehydratase/prephenate dehydrogenase
MNKVIGIIGGGGKMGGYFANFFRKNGFEVIVSDVKTKMTNKQLARQADVVIVSVPIDQAETVINEVAPLVKKSGLLMDLTSIKEKPMEALKKTKSAYLGCHPLFGPTAKIEGQIVILCKGRGALWHKWFQKLLEKNKVIVRELSAHRHDQLMAYIQTLNHFTEIVFADALRKSGIPIREFIKYPSPVYMLELFMMGRILNQDPKLYANIQLSNKENFKVIQSYLQSARELADTIEKKETKKNIQFFNRNAKYLDDFKKIAHQESDQLLKYLKLPQKNALFEKSQKPSAFEIAILGPQNTYSDMALHRYKKDAKAWYASSIAEVFDLVKKGKVKEGLVPIENTTTGSVRETLDELYEEGVLIEDIIAQPVNLALAGIKKIPLSQIKNIFSHGQPLLQSRRFIKKKCKKASTIAVSSTAAALERVMMEGEETSAAIASPIAIKAFNLEVIQKSIEDDPENTTHFALIRKGKRLLKKPQAKKISIAFHFKKDSPGSLNAILQDFAKKKLNLTKVESRPNPKVKGEYVFYIDFEGNSDNKNAQEVLKIIKGKVAKLKVLGVY